MELNFSGIDNMNTQNPYEQFNENNYGVDSNSEKYWERAKSEKEQQTKKKKVSFNDILTNMNLVVNKKGVLQFIQPAKPINEYQYDSQYDSQYDEQYVPQQRQNAAQRVPIAQSVKQSYIYNKYFKDYADANADPPPEKKVPKTVEEYNKMVMEERIKRVEEKKRIAEIKSTKLMFTTTPDNNFTQINPRNPRNIQTSRNNLKKMSFW
jgi:hypothetical protein